MTEVGKTIAQQRLIIWVLVLVIFVLLALLTVAVKELRGRDMNGRIVRGRRAQKRMERHPKRIQRDEVIPATVPEPRYRIYQDQHGNRYSSFDGGPLTPLDGGPL